MNKWIFDFKGKYKQDFLQVFQRSRLGKMEDNLMSADTLSYSTKRSGVNLGSFQIFNSYHQFWSSIYFKRTVCLPCHQYCVSWSQPRVATMQYTLPLSPWCQPHGGAWNSSYPEHSRQHCGATTTTSPQHDLKVKVNVRSSLNWVDVKQTTPRLNVELRIIKIYFNKHMIHLPKEHALCNGMSPPSSLVCTSAPASKRNSTISFRPNPAAKWRGVDLRPAVSRMLTSQPFCMRYRTRASSPVRHASNSSRPLSLWCGPYSTRNNKLSRYFIYQWRCAHNRYDEKIGKWNRTLRPILIWFHPPTEGLLWELGRLFLSYHKKRKTFFSRNTCIPIE